MQSISLDNADERFLVLAICLLFLFLFILIYWNTLEALHSTYWLNKIQHIKISSAPFFSFRPPV